MTAMGRAILVNTVPPALGPHEIRRGARPPRPRPRRGGRPTRVPGWATALAIRLAIPLAIALAIAMAIDGGLAGCGLLFHRDLPDRMIGLPRTFSSREGGLADVRRLRGLSG